MEPTDGRRNTGDESQTTGFSGVIFLEEVTPKADLVRWAVFS